MGRTEPHPLGRLTRVRCAAGAALTTIVCVALIHATEAQAANYFSAPFVVHTNPATFGQDPSWTRRGAVLSNETDRHTRAEEVMTSARNGSGKRCLTCGHLAGPNGFAQERPQGDWILFCSMGAQPQHLGRPCLGGYGSDLYVMRPDGSRPSRLTARSDPAHGGRYDQQPDPVPYDNYHPYWSPDGRHLIWTRTRAYPLARGGQRWEIMLGDFVVAHGRPRLAHIRVVAPAFGVYETQPWAPDGSGFLFTAFGPRSSPFESGRPGWMNLELYFMRLYGPGASPDHPRVTHITDDNPAYEEQAVFTPDMRNVIVMTNRNQPDDWYQTVVTAAGWLGFDPPNPGSVGGPFFLAAFSDPRFRTDLYMIDLATHAVRRLTNDHRVIPEFFWNRRGDQLLWSELLPGTEHFRTRVAHFAGIGAAQRVNASDSRPPASLRGAPIRAWTRPLPATRTVTRRRHIRPRRVAARLETGGVPPVTVTYLGLLVDELAQLRDQAGVRIPQPTL
jgi:hypothetical protein